MNPSPSPNHTVKRLVTALLCALTTQLHAATPAGWTTTQGTGKNAGAVFLTSDTPHALPVEVTCRFRASVGDSLSLAATDDTRPLLQVGFHLSGQNYATVSASAAGVPMATELASSRSWPTRYKNRGSLAYTWRYPAVRNLWDETDRKDIGAAYARLVPFGEKVFTLKLVLTATTRQIWLDDRLVAEERGPLPKAALFTLQLAKKTEVLALDFTTPRDDDRFLPLSLDQYSHQKDAQSSSELTVVKDVPAFLPGQQAPDVNLGESIYRYRLTHGTGPDAPYVNALRNWPNAFRVDPGEATFRVPYRNYQTAWLLAWLDDAPNSVPKGAFRFYRQEAGYCATTDFEISDAAIKSGAVIKLAQKTAAGKPLYLVKVPVDTTGLYGMRDLATQFLEFELTKPLALTRSYPDPIYYGYHPSGLPSSIHVVGITLETAPFDFEVKPHAFQFIFEQPEKPAYTVAVTNVTGKAIQAKVTLVSKSYDGDERQTVTGKATIKPGQTGQVELSFNLKKLGWHELKSAVEVNGVKRENVLSMVLLPPNPRTYGMAANETRFGTWNLTGHYIPLHPNSPETEPILAMYRKLGLRRVASDPTLMKKHDFLPQGPHTIISVVHRWKEDDLAGQQKIVDVELAAVGALAQNFAAPTYFYGGEWGLGHAVQYAPNTRYTGDGNGELTPEEKTKAEAQTKIFTKIGRALKEKYPQAKLLLQWGAPQGTLAYLQTGIPKDIVDGFGMDAPMFELIPEISNMTGSLNQLWQLREEAKRMGWPRMPIHWCEGPFFPTNPGALTEKDQMDYQIRYLLGGLAYGIDQFESAVVPHDAGNYYGAEHYGAGLIHRTPLENPKPAVAAVATMTAMLCGADPIGGVDTGNLTTFAMAFERAKDKSKIFALWRVNGKVDATLKVQGTDVVVTDTMGNPTKLPVKNGTVVVSVSQSPIWLTGVQAIEKFEFGKPSYDTAPSKVTRPLTGMTADQWDFDTSEDKTYAYNHFAIRRIPDSNLKAEFGQGEEGYADAVGITLPVEPGDRPLATRYGALKLKQPVTIPGKANALGIWVKGNSSWGRVVYQLRDAKGELWTSVGTKDDWNGDDTHAWSYVNFEGWRYVRFPLPGNAPYDAARELETTWWGSHGGDGVVDLPLTVAKIIVEARNEIPYLSEMKLVPNRTYKLSGLVAEYATEDDATPTAIAKASLRRPTPEWEGPAQNPIARLSTEGSGEAPKIKEFTEPTHFNDGRNMVIHFDPAEGQKYNLYLARYTDGRGAELIKADVKNDQTIGGLRPETKMFLFLTSVAADKKESKPSPAFELVTHDRFAEK